MMRRDFSRRLARLEKRIPQPVSDGIDPVTHRAWLKTLSDDDLDFMAGIAAHLQAGGSYGDFDIPTLERLDTILATCETFGGQ